MRLLVSDMFFPTVTGQLVDWTSHGLDNSQTGQLAD